MVQLLRLSALALAASLALSVAAVVGYLVVAFFVAEWRPDWTIAESLYRWLTEPPPATSPYDAAGPAPASPATRLWLFIGAIAVPFAYYLLAWWAIGRDRLRGTEFPRFTPPDRLSPAGVRQVLGMGFDGKVMAAQILSLAVRGHLRIARDDAGDHALTRADGASGGLTTAERHLLAALFRGGRRVRIQWQDGPRLRVAMEAFRARLEDEFEGPAYATNIWAVALGVVVSGSMFVLAADTFVARPDEAGSLSLALGTLLGVIVLVNALFFRLMKAPTELGRGLLDEIAGFRMFLATAEHERIKLVDAPSMTPDLYARYLPYALAMDLEQDWSERFAATLGAAIPDPADFGWYERAAHGLSDDSLLSMARSMGSAVAALVLQDEPGEPEIR